MKAETVQAGDAEWHAGWLALRFLNNPQAAEKHFETMLDKIYMPISEARGYYWLGRARQAQGKTAAAHKAFEQAANYGFTFYGQLAAERLGLKNAKLPSSIEVSASKQAAFEAKNMVKAVKLLANVSPARTQRRILLTHMAMNTKDEAEQKLIGALAHAAGEDTFSVKLAKMAMRQGVFVKDMSYPAPHYFRGKAKSSEDALLMALTRQESEYDTDAISHVGARGLMQLMPGTAREVSNKLGLGYSDFKLNNDPDYNIMLGTYYIEQQVNRFDGSYVLALAGYNAGPSRAINWSSTFGNPQSSDVDAVDFIELIPFEETRNYVQRIMETVPIYRSILNNEPVKATLSKDLKR
jgi:soluble lytic murein transglycosylase